MVFVIDIDDYSECKGVSCYYIALVGFYYEETS